MTANPTTTAPANALDALLSNPALASMINLAPTLATAAAAARAERTRLVSAAAAAASGQQGLAIGAAVPADGAAPIIRAPWTGSVPTADPTYHAPVQFLTRLRVHAKRNKPVILTGPAGTGKTEAVMLIAAEAQRPFVKVDCAPVRESADWFGTQTSVGGRIAWQDSTLVAALATEGAVILLDEINRANTHALNGLLGILDGTRRANFPQRPEAVTLANGVMVFATANIGLDYAGTGTLDRALRNRFTVVPTDYLSVEDEAAVIKRRNPDLAQTFAVALARIAAHTRTLAFVNAGGEPISTRQALVAAEMAVAFGVDGSSEGLALHGLIDSQTDETMGGSQSPRAALAAFITRSFPNLAV